MTLETLGFATFFVLIAFAIGVPIGFVFIKFTKWLIRNDDKPL